MDAETTQALRRLLAEASAEPPRPPGLIARLRAWRRGRSGDERGPAAGEAPSPSPWRASDAPPKLEPPWRDGQAPSVPGPPIGVWAFEPAYGGHQVEAFVPLDVLAGSIAPRRTAFGQRRSGPNEGSPALAPSTLCPRDPDRDPPLRSPRPFAALESETPFFPEDLIDEPLGLRALSAPAAALEPAPQLPRDVAEACLLASLAARLAAEKERLDRRVESACAPPDDAGLQGSGGAEA